MPYNLDQLSALHRNLRLLAWLAALLLIVWWLPTPLAWQGIAHYLPIHMALETLAIVIALLVFLVTWNAHLHQRTGNIIVLACAMLAVGLIDFAHMLSYPGMPDFVTPGSAEKAINFWLAARILAALALLATAALPRLSLDSRPAQYLALGAALGICTAIYWAGLFHEDQLPATFIEGQGLTAFKVAFEWLIIGILLAAAALFYRQAGRKVGHDAASLFAAAAISVLSELCFTLYKDVADVFNLLGHMYKAGAYLFIYKAVFVETIHAPYLGLSAARASLLAEQEALRQTMHRMDTVANASPALFWTAGLDMGCDWFNRSWLEFTGRSMEQELGEGWTEGVHPDDLARCMATYAAAFETRQAFSMEYRLRRHDASYRWILDQGKPRHDADAKFIGYIGSCLDITESKRVDQALRETEQRDRNIVEHSTDLIVTTRSGRITYINPTGLQILRARSSDEIVGRSPLEFFHPDCQAAVQLHIANAEAKSGSATSLIGLRMNGIDGTTIDVDLTAVSYASGEQVETQVICRDLTEHNRAMHALKISEERLRLALEAAQQGIYDLNVQTGVAHVTTGYATMLGYDPAEFSETNAAWIERLHPDDQAMVAATYTRYVAGELPEYRVEFRQRTRGGDWKWILSIGSLVERSVDGQPLRMLGTHTDITDLRETQDALRRLNAELEQRVAERTAELRVLNQSLESFVYSVSHDLKTPLRGVEGYSRLLQDDYGDKLDAEGRLFIDNIRAGVTRMNELIDDLLDYSRMERRTMERTPIDLRRAVDEVLAERVADLAGRLARFDKTMPTIILSADSSGVALVLRNVVENALKFSARVAEPRIEIGGREDEHTVTLWIRDNGIGFDMKYHDRIFEIFQRLHRLEDYPGTGIGLALVSKAMQRMGGRVWAESRPGHGASFYLEWPKRIASTDRAPEKPSPDAKLTGVA